MFSAAETPVHQSCVSFPCTVGRPHLLVQRVTVFHDGVSLRQFRRVRFDWSQFDNRCSLTSLDSNSSGSCRSQSWFSIPGSHQLSFHLSRAPSCEHNWREIRFVCSALLPSDYLSPDTTSSHILTILYIYIYIYVVTILFHLFSSIIPHKNHYREAWI